MIDKVLITGSSGLIGSTAARYFSQFSKVVGIDNNLRQYFTGEDTEPVRHDLQRMGNFQYRYANVCYFDSIIQIVEHEKPDLIINCAAQSSIDVSKDKPMSDFNINALGTVHMLQAAKYYAKDAVFVHLNQTSIPDCPMKSSKKCAELMTLEYGNSFQMKTVSFNCSNIVGTKEQKCGLLNKICNQVLNKQKTMLPPLTKRIDFLYAWDLMIAIHMFAENPKCGVAYEIGGGTTNSCTVECLIEKIIQKKHFDYTCENDVGLVADISDNSNFKKDFPTWEITRSIDSILEELLD